MHRNLLGVGWVVVGLCVLASGCSVSSGAAETTRTSPPAPTPMTAGPILAGRPSPTARLVCSDEIRGDIAETLSLASLPAGTGTWTQPMFRCDYQTPDGRIQLLVQDSARVPGGTAYFNDLRTTLAPTIPIRGLANLGLPAFETSAGQVVFLKDGKTLRVDTSGLPLRTGPHRQTRTAVAYAIAADVIGCWSE